MTVIKRLVCLHNMVAPYRIPFFEALSNLPGWRLKVLFTSILEPNRHWSTPSNLPFNAEVVPSRIFRWGDSYLHVTKGLSEMLRAESPDVLLLSGMGPASAIALRWGNLNGVPCIVWWGGHPLAKSSSSTLRKSWRRNFLRKCDNAITYSSAGARYLISLGMRPEKVTSIGNTTFDACSFRTQIESKRPSFESREDEFLGELYGLFVGQLIPRKNVMLLPDVVRRVVKMFDDFHFVVMGDGPLRRKIARRAHELGVDARIRLLGDRPREEVFRYYSRAMMLVHPTLLDPWSQVVNEAAASGLPIVTTPNEGSVGDLLIHEKSALICSPDAQSISLAVESLLRSVDLRQSLSLQAYEAICRQDLDDVVAQVERILSRLRLDL